MDGWICVGVYIDEPAECLAWSFMDNFEWALGYTKRFGMHYVDYDTMVRTPKASSKWFSQVLKQNAVPKPMELSTPLA